MTILPESHAFDNALDQQLRDLVQTVQPDAVFAKQLEQAIANHVIHVQRGKARQRVMRFAGLIAAAVFLMTTAAVVTVPSIRTFAQSVVDLLLRVPSPQTVEVWFRDDLEGIQTFTSVDDAEQALGIDIAQPRYLPSFQHLNREKTFELEAVTFNATQAALEVSYQYVQWNPYLLRLTVMPVERYQPLFIGDEAYIEETVVTFQGERVTAQYITGDWITFYDPANLPSPSANTIEQADIQWLSDLPYTRLIWQSDTWVYVLRGDNSPYIDFTMEEMIAIAESISD